MKIQQKRAGLGGYNRPVWIVEGAFGRVMLSDSVRGLVLSLLLNPAWLATAFHLDVLTSVFALTLVRVTDPIKEATGRLLCAIQSPGGGNALQEHVKELVGAVLCTYGQRRSLTVRKGRPSDFRIKRAKAYIDANISEGLRLEEVARRVGLSRSHFFKQFRLCVGVPPHCYVDWLRLAMATHWLATSDRPLRELSAQLGFSAQSHFTRFFNQHLGMSPMAYRRRLVPRAQG